MRDVRIPRARGGASNDVAFDLGDSLKEGLGGLKDAVRDLGEGLKEAIEEAAREQRRKIDAEGEMTPYAKVGWTIVLAALAWYWLSSWFGGGGGARSRDGERGARSA
eukprot:29515-Pelagococcus_subviridis.AAC.1